MVICDTTVMNSERLNGVVMKLKNAMVNRVFPGAQYICYQHHILDRFYIYKLNCPAALKCGERGNKTETSLISQLTESSIKFIKF